MGEKAVSACDLLALEFAGCGDVCRGCDDGQTQLHFADTMRFPFF